MVERRERSGRTKQLVRTLGIFALGFGVGSLNTALIYKSQLTTVEEEVRTVKQRLSDSLKEINNWRIEMSDLRALLEDYRKRFENPPPPQIEKPADRIL